MLKFITESEQCELKRAGIIFNATIKYNFDQIKMLLYFSLKDNSNFTGNIEINNHLP